MNFVEAAYQVVSHNPIASICGVAVSAVVLWRGARAAFKAIQADVERDRKLEEKVAKLPRVPNFVPPQERPRT